MFMPPFAKDYLFWKQEKYTYTSKGYDFELPLGSSIELNVNGAFSVPSSIYYILIIISYRILLVL